ncbi:MAG: SMI1/KNR4 family protein [Phycisphaerales bacterium]
MDNIEKIMRQISQKTGVRCGPAKPDELETLRELGFPPKVIEFYERFIPEDAIEIGPCILTIHDIRRMCLYDRDPVSTAAFGASLLPFGEDMSGDLLCFDPDRLDDEGWPLVVTVSHEVVDEDSTPEEVRQGAEEYCKNLPELLKRMVSGE